MTPNTATGNSAFMLLPTEIRLMIYERIPIELKVRDFTHHAPDTPDSEPSRFSLIDRTVSTSILRVNRQVSEEAEPIMQLKKGFLLCYPLRMLFDTANAHFKKWGPLPYISSYLLFADWMAKMFRIKRDGSTSPPAIPVDAASIRGDPNFTLIMPVAYRWAEATRFRMKNGLARQMEEGLHVPSIEIAFSSAPQHSNDPRCLLEKLLEWNRIGRPSSPTAPGLRSPARDRHVPERTQR